MAPLVSVAVKALLMTGGGGNTVNARVAVPVPPVFIALITTLLVPVAVVEPLITPVEVLTARPEGRPLAAKLDGVLVAVIW